MAPNRVIVKKNIAFIILVLYNIERGELGC